MSFSLSPKAHASIFTDIFSVISKCTSFKLYLLVLCWTSQSSALLGLWEILRPRVLGPVKGFHSMNFTAQCSWNLLLVRQEICLSAEDKSQVSRHADIFCSGVRIVVTSLALSYKETPVGRTGAQDASLWLWMYPLMMGCEDSCCTLLDVGGRNRLLFLAA